MIDRLSTLEVAGRTVAYQDVGCGPAVILVHCSSTSHKEWAPLVAALRDRYRVLAPDLIGYGKLEPRNRRQPLDPMADVNVVLGLAALVGQAVHLAGHSYGAAVALEAARILGASAKSLTLVEPVAFHVLKLAGRTTEWARISTLSERVQAAAHAERDKEAAAAYMAFWIGRLRWWFMPPRLRRSIIATVAKVAAEFGFIERTSTTLADYASVGVPRRLIVGGRTRKPARAVTEVLGEILPRARQLVLPRAGHMSPFTHATAISHLMAAHIDACERELTSPG